MKARYAMQSIKAQAAKDKRIASATGPVMPARPGMRRNTHSFAQPTAQQSRNVDTFVGPPRARAPLATRRMKEAMREQGIREHELLDDDDEPPAPTRRNTRAGSSRSTRPRARVVEPEDDYDDEDAQYSVAVNPKQPAGAGALNQRMQDLTDMFNQLQVDLNRAQEKSRNQEIEIQGLSSELTQIKKNGVEANVGSRSARRTEDRLRSLEDSLSQRIQKLARSVEGRMAVLALNGGATEDAEGAIAMPQVLMGLEDRLEEFNYRLDCLEESVFWMYGQVLVDYDLPVSAKIGAPVDTYLRPGEWYLFSYPMTNDAADVWATVRMVSETGEQNTGWCPVFAVPKHIDGLDIKKVPRELATTAMAMVGNFSLVPPARV